MNRYDDWRQGREWRGNDRESGGGDRDDRDERNLRGSFYPGNYGFEENERSGRTSGSDDNQPYSRNPYGRYPGQSPGQQRRGGGREEWRSQPGQRYGQREPYNPSRSGSMSGPSSRSSRYSESQYGTPQYGGRRYGTQMGGGGNLESRFDQGSQFDRGSRFDRGGAFGEGPFSDTSQSPRFYGTGNYADGGASYTGGYDERQGYRNYGSLYGGEEQSHRREGIDRYRDNRYDGPQPRRYATGPKGYTRSDERLREEISERLMMANSVDSSDVTVSVKDAKVTLEGTVPDRRMKHAIEDLADQCPGVQDVDNRIRVQREEWGSSTSPASSTISASGATPTAGTSSTTTTSSGTTFGGKGRKE